jgi:hypothetical protein
MAQGIRSQTFLRVLEPSGNAGRYRKGRWKMEGRFKWLSTSPERIKTVIEEISYGSELFWQPL